ncbi:MAG: discoidin domain-containing protein [Phycisphaerae bacterium]|nr:discoidin domain-containing protein [Phycisphaerae bacterium]
MGKRLVAWTLCVFVASLIAGPLAHAGDPALIGWWKLNDGSGDVATDFSENGNHGTIVRPTAGLGPGGSVWLDDSERGTVISFNGTASGAYVRAGQIPQMTFTNDFTWVFWAKQQAGNAENDIIIGNRMNANAVDFSPRQFIKFTPTKLEWHQNSLGTDNLDYDDIPNDVWLHHVVVKTGAQLTYFRNGVEAAARVITQALDYPMPLFFGGDNENAEGENWAGMLSDVRVYTRALTVSEILRAMAGKGPDAELAAEPVPEDRATDVLFDVELTWAAGESAATHDVYLGTSFADVNSASRDNPTGVLVGQDLTTAQYQVEAALEYGKVYYWRVDEVNGAPEYTVFKGDVWSFTVEPYAYPVKPTMATASSAVAGAGPMNTINESGLVDDQHSTDMTQMWLTPKDSLPAWILYEFDREYALYELWVWNSNYMMESTLGYGAKDVAIEYSTDGQTWTQLEGVPQFNQATSQDKYAANTIVDLGGVTAKYVKLTISTNWGGFMTQTGLSEVRFFQVPVQARDPEPADGQTGISVNASLEWRPGRKAASHAIYFGTDSNAVAEGSVSAVTQADHGYTPGSPLALATTYYWRVDEVGDDATYAGNVWSFTTEEYVTVDDFESYDDDMDAGTAIFQTWKDGYDIDENGSVVGYEKTPFAEPTVVFGGDQSMPFSYDNNSKGATYSEAARTFDDAQNWTDYGVQTLAIYFMGDAANTGSGQLYVKINGTKVLYDGAATDLTIGVWQAWTIDLASIGVNLKKITSLAVGVTGSGAVGQLFVDEIRLYPTASVTVTPVDPGTTGLVAWYKFDGDAKDSAGSHHGVATGSPGYTTGKVGQALNMTSDAQYVLVPYSADLAMSTFTVAAWVNVADLDALRAILGTRIGGDYTFDFKVTSASVHSDVGNGTAWLNSNIFVYEDQGGLCDIGVWYYLATVVDDVTDTAKTYINGALAQTATFSGTPMFMQSGQSLGIGYCSSGEYMHGQLDEVRIYNRALSDAEMAGLAGRTGTIYVAP